MSMADDPRRPAPGFAGGPGPVALCRAPRKFLATNAYSAAARNALRRRHSIRKSVSITSPNVE